MDYQKWVRWVWSKYHSPQMLLNNFNTLYFKVNERDFPAFTVVNNRSIGRNWWLNFLNRPESFSAKKWKWRKLKHEGIILKGDSCPADFLKQSRFQTVPARSVWWKFGKHGSCRVFPTSDSRIQQQFNRRPKHGDTANTWVHIFTLSSLPRESEGVSLTFEIRMQPQLARLQGVDTPSPRPTTA